MSSLSSSLVKNNSVVNKLMFPSPKSTYGNITGLFYIPLDKEIEISCLLIGHFNNALLVDKNTKDIPSRPVIIVCHGNVTDIGQLVNQMYRICNLTKCHILLMEYPGYGMSSKVQTTQENCELAIEKTVDFVVNNLKISSNNIIFYGRSIGSGIATYGMKYCCQTYSNPVGLILVNPCLSIKELANSMLDITPIIDRFVIKENIKFCTNTHVLIIHDERDKVIPVSQGKELAKIASKHSQFDIQVVFSDNTTHNYWNKKNDIEEPIRNFVKNINWEINPYDEHQLVNVYWKKQFDDKHKSNAFLDTTTCSIATSTKVSYDGKSSIWNSCQII